jgi:hypothetical protein
MRSAHRFAAAAFVWLASCWFGAGQGAAASCDSLAGMKVGDAWITAAGNISPPFSIVGQVPSKVVSLSLPFCRVEGTIRPTADSDIRFELWLPPASAWNNKYEGLGNGGFAGSIQYEPMSWALDAGYAVSGTDTGHVGSAIDARWAPATRRRWWISAGEPSTKPLRPPKRSSRPIMAAPRHMPIQRMLRRRPRGANGGATFPGRL